MAATAPQLAYSAPPRDMQRWRLEFTAPWGELYWCEVDAPTALQAVTEALRHGEKRPGAPAMLFADTLSVTRADTLLN